MFSRVVLCSSSVAVLNSPPRSDLPVLRKLVTFLLAFFLIPSWEPCVHVRAHLKWCWGMGPREEWHYLCVCDPREINAGRSQGSMQCSWKLTATSIRPSLPQPAPPIMTDMRHVYQDSGSPSAPWLGVLGQVSPFVLGGPKGHTS